MSKQKLLDEAINYDGHSQRDSNTLNISRDYGTYNTDEFESPVSGDDSVDTEETRMKGFHLEEMQMRAYPNEDLLYDDDVNDNDEKHAHSDGSVYAKTKAGKMVQPKKARRLFRRHRRQPDDRRRFGRRAMQQAVFTDSEIDADEMKKRVAAFSPCAEYNLDGLYAYLKSVPGLNGSLKQYTEVIQIKHKADDRHTFVFSYGVVVFFNSTEQQEEQFMTLSQEYQIDRFTTDDIPCEEMDYCYGDHFKLSNDVITLATRSSLEKLSVGFAMAQCVKLNIFEDRIETVIEDTKHIPEGLARLGTIDLSTKGISKKIGELFIERTNINFHYDILDTPEYFWEEDQYKFVYDRLNNYLELGRRVDILNKRLDILHELFDMLSNQVDHQKATKLEWTIIVLIVLEVSISIIWNILIKDILGYFNHGST